MRRGRHEGGPPQACRSGQAGLQSDDGEHHAPREGHGEPGPWERDEHRLGDDGGRRAPHAAGPAERG